MIFLLTLPNHEESDFHADAKDSNSTLLAEKKKGGDQASNKNKHTDSSVRAMAV